MEDFMFKVIIIMTKSSKNGDYCIAGIDAENGSWIRLVSGNEETHGAVMREDAVYPDGTEVEIFDIVRVKLIGREPSDCQTENWRYAPKCYWEKVGKSDLKTVINLRGEDTFEDEDYIFGNDVTNKTAHDRVNGRSLALLKVKSPRIFVKTFPTKKDVTFWFTYNNKEYKFFKVSDRSLREKYKPKADGFYSDFVNECYVVVSLTGERDGFHYKMLAQLF